MRVPIYTVAVPFLVAAAFAQDTPPAQPQQPKQPTETAAPATQAKPPETGAPSTTAKPTDAAMPQMKTQTYSGTLVDASCAGSSAATPPPAVSSSQPAAAAAAASSADRTAGSGNTQSCTLSASTTQFALQMKDGSVVRFDDVGNARVQEAMKSKKKWTESASASKPFRIKANGVLNGNKLTVLDVD